MAEYIPALGEQTKTRPKEKVEKPPKFTVLMHNDDYTTMDFVVYVLISIYSKPEDEAVRIMLNVHHQGVGICGVYTEDIAQTKIAQTHAEAQREGYPLRCSMEPA